MSKEEEEEEKLSDDPATDSTSSTQTKSGNSTVSTKKKFTAALISPPPPRNPLSYTTSIVIRSLDAHEFLQMFLELEQLDDKDHRRNKLQSLADTGATFTEVD